MSKQVLVVNHNTGLLSLVQIMLEQAGYIALKASSIPMAWKLLEAQQPHLVILDINMPEQDSIALCKQIRSQSGMKHVPVLVLADRYDRQGVTESLQAGANDFLYKPILHHDLIDKAHLLLSQANGH
jgi:DNA-binding response OmpR family regulator